MSTTTRIVATIGILGAASIGWMTLGAVTTSRSQSSDNHLGERVDDLWGGQQTQTPPVITFRWQTTPREQVEREVKGKKVAEWVTLTDNHDKAVPLASSAITADLQSELRRKGLRWYSLYGIGFEGQWSYVHEDSQPGWLDIAFTFPDAQGLYDNFHFLVDGVERSAELAPENGTARLSTTVGPGQRVTIAIGYQSRGRDQWVYSPGSGVNMVRDFSLGMTTNFADIDFPHGGLSPSTKARAGAGWKLGWTFKRVVTGQSFGVVTPRRIQPGELAAALSFSAPISLLFFVGVIFAFAILRGIDIHPLNYLMLASSFFAFHLLFSYTADRLPVEGAFALASAVSLILVVSYLRLVVSNRFAYREAAAAQLVYLVGFSLAHFWEGFTGLTVTILAILTLFLLMQMTGRVRWSSVLGTNAPNALAPESAQRA